MDSLQIRLKSPQKLEITVVERESLDICTFRHWEKMHILTKMDLWWNFPLR